MTTPEDPVDEQLPDDSVPAESRPSARADAIGSVSAPDEIGANLAIQQGAEVGGKTLTTLLFVHPFTGLFCHLAHRHLEEFARETRVRRYRRQAPAFWWICVTLDCLVMGVVVLVLVAAATAVLYKTLWLGP